MKAHLPVKPGAKPIFRTKRPVPYAALELVDREFNRLQQAVQNYPCDQCSRTFRLKQYLIAHIQQVHEKRLAKCEVCGTTFASLGNLKKHEKSIHGGKYMIV
uniref:Myoneurin n=1 Tax=Schistosoma haematobium TaxID=6185 RepID=A0A095A5Z4_SCHHA